MQQAACNHLYNFLNIILYCATTVVSVIFAAAALQSFVVVLLTVSCCCDAKLLWCRAAERISRDDTEESREKSVHL